MRLLSTLVMIIISSIALMAQLTIDATAPVHQNTREAMTVHGGGVGRKIPLEVSISVVGGWHEDGKIEVDFLLTNTGKSELAIPVSLNSANPTDRKVRYARKCLSLRVSGSKSAADILLGGADLGGSSADPGTLILLSSAESIRVITLVALPREPAKRSSDDHFVAHASLVEETTDLAERTIDMHEIGSASSKEYNLESLLGGSR